MLLLFFWGLRYGGAFTGELSRFGRPIMAELSEHIEDNPDTAYEKTRTGRWARSV